MWQVFEATVGIDSSRVYYFSSLDHYLRRCECPRLKETLLTLRTGKPSVRQLHHINRGHKAPSKWGAGYIPDDVPTLDVIRAVLEETPDTMFLTISRWACGLFNDLAIRVLFHSSALLSSCLDISTKLTKENLLQICALFFDNAKAREESLGTTYGDHHLELLVASGGSWERLDPLAASGSLWEPFRSWTFDNLSELVYAPPYGARPRGSFGNL